MEKIYKDASNKVHVIDEGFVHLLPTGCVEITQSEADALLAPTPEQIAAVIQSGLTTARQMREVILNRLAGISGRYQRSGDLAAAVACDAAVVALLNITKAPTVLASTDELSLKVAILTEYRNIVAGLSVSAPYAVAAFEGYEA